NGNLLPPARTSSDIADAGFESQGLAEGGHDASPLADWVYPRRANLTAGIFNPGADCYQGAAGYQTPQGAEGFEVLSLENSGGDPGLGWAYQVLSTTLEEGRTYTLGVAVGRRLPGNSRGTTEFGGYELQLLAGNRVIQTSRNTVSPIPGTFETDVLTVSMDDLDAPPLGSPLTIRMRLTWPDAGSATDFDWVRLDVQ
ncbi:MAG: hypothetical protein KDB61_08620, partial [Planctomycetes bacterium]|nr:hypothetical protein [Planctomycetota bacterium]